MDKISKEARGRNMSRIKSKNTKPELLVRRYLRSKKLRYRIHYKLPGTPDIIFPSKKIALFIHGCFWHGHSCKNSHIPKTNIAFWKEKISKNKERDLKSINLLIKKGWKPLILWECSLPLDLEIIYRKINLNSC